MPEKNLNALEALALLGFGKSLRNERPVVKILIIGVKESFGPFLRKAPS